MSFRLPVKLGAGLDIDEPDSLNRDDMSQHLHACEATGYGKSVPLNRRMPRPPSTAELSLFVVLSSIDPLGGFPIDRLKQLLNAE